MSCSNSVYSLDPSSIYWFWDTRCSKRSTTSLRVWQWTRTWYWLFEWWCQTICPKNWWIKLIILDSSNHQSQAPRKSNPCQYYRERWAEKIIFFINWSIQITGQYKYTVNIKNSLGQEKETINAYQSHDSEGYSSCTIKSIKIFLKHTHVYIF